MSRRGKIFAAKSVAILSVIPILIQAHSAGPDPGKSGVPGEATCNDIGCHAGTGLNAGGGSVQILAEGTTYIPGVAQQISVTVSDPTERRWGFQFTARLASDAKTRAGLITPTDTTATQLICSTATLLEQTCSSNPILQFIEHTSRGAVMTAVGEGNTFHFQWTPPATDVGDVILYAAGNAANGNTLETGDHIYTTTLRLSPAAAGAKPAISEAIDAENLKATISPNGFITIKGSNLANTTREWQGSDFNGNRLPTSLDGTSVKINGNAAFPSFISPAQINALVAVDTAVGPVSVQVTRNGVSSDAGTVQMAQLTPAFVIFNFDKYIAARHSDATASLLGPTTLYPGLTTPAKPGETILLFGTGFGPTTPAIVSGQVVSGAPKLASALTIRFGGVDITPDFAGLSATGLYQFNVKVPDSAANGDVPVVATINGVSTQANAFITVQR